MNKPIVFRSLVFGVLLFLLLAGCGPAEETPTGPPRDTTPKVLVPEASGSTVFQQDTAIIDASNAPQGYFMVKYAGSVPKIKVQVKAPGSVTYTYQLSGGSSYQTFPLSAGDGGYQISVLENVEGDMYAVLLTADVSVALSDEFLPFLYPNQYVNFTPESAAVKKGAELAANTYSDIDVIRNVYAYVTENVQYDIAKADSVQPGYLPSVDETLSTGKGICFDYASLMCAMLRTQGIPSKLEIGYSGEAKHAWISAYVEGQGWIDKVIQFEANTWTLMDPTLAANNDSGGVAQYIGDGTNYTLQYSY